MGSLEDLPGVSLTCANTGGRSLLIPISREPVALVQAWHSPRLFFGGKAVLIPLYLSERIIRPSFWRSSMAIAWFTNQHLCSITSIGGTTRSYKNNSMITQ